MRVLRILRAISRWCSTAWRSSPSAARAVESYAVSRRSRSGNGPKTLVDVAFGAFATGATPGKSGRVPYAGKSGNDSVSRTQPDRTILQQDQAMSAYRDPIRQARSQPSGVRQTRINP